MDKEKDTTAVGRESPPAPGAGEGGSMADNLFTAYMDYLQFMDRYNAPTESAPQPPTLTEAQRAKLDKAIEAACMEYFKAEKGEN